MPNPKRRDVTRILVSLCVLLAGGPNAWAQDSPHQHGDSEHAEESPETPEVEPQSRTPDAELPAGMTLDDVLARAEKPPPDDYPDAIPDDHLRAFLIVDQLEYRYDLQGEPDAVGTEFSAWFGGDFNRLWLKGEGEASWQGEEFEGESDVDLLYGRLIAPFWTAQAGVQYANVWGGENYRDFWAAALAIQGLAPGMFEVDASIYVTEKLNILATFEAEYDIRITQRLVLQPRTELRFSARDSDARGIGAGMNSVVVDLRLRYAFWREFAPYLGARFEALVFGTGDIAAAAGEDSSRFFVVGGVRFAVY